MMIIQKTFVSIDLMTESIATLIGSISF